MPRCRAAIVAVPALHWPLVFFELPGSVVCCLTLIWGNSQSLLFQVFFLFLLLLYSHYVYVTSVIVIPQSLSILGFLFQSLFFFAFWGLYWISSASESFLSQVQFTKLIKYILHFCYTVLYLRIFFLKISILCIHCSSVLHAYFNLSEHLAH